MGRATAYFVLVAALFAANIAGRVHAAELLAFQGLTPPASAFERDAPGTMAATAAGLSFGTGLRLPYRPGERGDDGPGFLERDAGGSSLYSGTRPILRPGLEHSRTFGGLRYPMSRTWASSLEASVESPSATATRAYGLQGELQRLLPGGWDVRLGLQYNIHEPGDYRLHAGTGDPWSLSSQGLLPSPVPPGASTSGYELRFSLHYGGRNSVGLTYGSGRELDYTRQMFGLYPGDGRQFGVTGQHWLTPDWAISYGLMAQEQFGVHRGQGLRFGLRYRF
jgi:YaiO family outer membrane protein